MVRTKVPSLRDSFSFPAEGRKRRKEADAEEMERKKKRVDSSNEAASDDTLRYFFDGRIPEYQKFSESFDGRRVIKGKVFDFETFNKWNLPIAEWFSYQGWDELLGYKDIVYPKLAQILIANYDPTDQKSWIGKVKIDMSPSKIREIFGLEEVDEDILWPVNRQNLFSEIARTEVREKSSFLHSKYLDINQKLAHHIIYNNIFPRVGSTDQLPERDAKVLWALMNKKRIDFGKLMSEHLQIAKNSSKLPIPYGMILTRFIRIYNINVRGEAGEQLKSSDVIGENTVKRMGFKLTPQGWIGKHTQGIPLPQKKRKPSVTEPRRGATVRATEAEEEEEEEAESSSEKGSEDHSSEAEEDQTETQRHHPQPPSSQPPQPQPRPQHHSPPQPPSSQSTQPQPPKPATKFSSDSCSKPFIVSQFQELQTHLEHILASNFSILTTKLDQLESSMNFKYDLLRTQIESLHPTHPSQAPPKKMKGVVIHSPHSTSSDTSPFQPSPFPTHAPTDIPSTSQPQPPCHPEPTQGPTSPPPSTHPLSSPIHSPAPTSALDRQLVLHPTLSQNPTHLDSPALTEVLSSVAETEVLELSDTSTSDSSTSTTSSLISPNPISSQPLSFTLQKLPHSDDARASLPALPAPAPTTTSSLPIAPPPGSTSPATSPKPSTHQTPSKASASPSKPSLPSPTVTHQILSSTDPVFMTNDQFFSQVRANRKAQSAWFQAGAHPDSLHLPYPLLAIPAYVKRIRCVDNIPSPSPSSSNPPLPKKRPVSKPSTKPH